MAEGRKRPPQRIALAWLLTLGLLLAACKPADSSFSLSSLLHRKPMPEQPQRLRDLIPPLFFPHRTSFTCVRQDAVLPPVPPEAEALLQQALITEFNNGRPTDETDWQKVVDLTRQAAERGAWKARLNLIHLRIEGRGAPYGLPPDREIAVQEVEAAMALGIPDAFELMGNFYERSIGVKSDMGKAYAFYQYAADRGSPAAQTFLGDMLDATYDDPQAGFWGNRKIGRQMLECAFSQGYGKAAYQLGLSYSIDIPENPAMREKALRIFHEGVKMGNGDCAAALAGDFEHGNRDDTSVAPLGVDTERAKRYWSLLDSLRWYRSVHPKLPNLDRVLPLPPARLPPWDGDRDSLYEAAQTVRRAPKPAAPSAASQRQGRHHLPAGHAFGTPQPFDARRFQWRAPQDGYYLLSAELYRPTPETLAMLDGLWPARYAQGEALPAAERVLGELKAYNPVWLHVPVQPLAAPPVPPRVAQGIERQAPHLPQAPVCRGDMRCPQTGYWQARVSAELPLAALVNGQPLRQAWVNEGQAFPDPQKDWGFEQSSGLHAGHLAWRLLEPSQTLAAIGQAW